jgi:prolyl-tRNA synthetase
VEFLWQEGHTVHATAEDAEEETLRMLNVYASFCEEYLAIPVVKGQKTEKEKFAGAKATYTIESLMHDGKALQSGTSHNFGDGFARAFGIQFLDKDNQLKYAHQTSWGMTTRLIGALIMVHGDDSGLVLPPRVAPVQLVIVPVQQHVEGVLDKAYELKEKLSKVCRVKVDDSDKMPGWKFSEHEMRGVPLRLEVGPKDIQKNQVVLVKRENREKLFVGMDELETLVPKLLDEIQESLFNKALKLREERTYTALDLDEFEKKINESQGFIKAMWCGDEECEKTVKERTAATARCIPLSRRRSATNACAAEKKPSTWFTGAGPINKNEAFKPGEISRLFYL